MKKQSTGWLITFALIIAVSAAAQAQGPGCGQGGMKDRIQGKMGDRMIQMLDLDEEQAEAVKNLSYEHRKKAIELRAEAEILQLELEQLMDAEDPDREQIADTVEAIGEIRTEIEKANTLHRLDIQDIVGAEKLDELKQQMKERMQEHRQNRSRKGGQGFRGRRGGERGSPSEE